MLPTKGIKTKSELEQKQFLNLIRMSKIFKQNKTKQDKTKQNKTKQYNIIQNQIKQNQIKQIQKHIILQNFQYQYPTKFKLLQQFYIVKGLQKIQHPEKKMDKSLNKLKKQNSEPKFYVSTTQFVVKKYMHEKNNNKNESQNMKKQLSRQRRQHSEQKNCLNKKLESFGFEITKTLSIKKKVHKNYSNQQQKKQISENIKQFHNKIYQSQIQENYFLFVMGRVSISVKKNLQYLNAIQQDTIAKLLIFKLARLKEKYYKTEIRYKNILLFIHFYAKYKQQFKQQCQKNEQLFYLIMQLLFIKTQNQQQSISSIIEICNLKQCSESQSFKDLPNLVAQKLSKYKLWSKNVIKKQFIQNQIHQMIDLISIFNQNSIKNGFQKICEYFLVYLSNCKQKQDQTNWQKGLITIILCVIKNITQHTTYLKISRKALKFRNDIEILCKNMFQECFKFLIIILKN